jgi:hypothetical protein
MESIRRYPIDYRPRICSTEAVLYYYKTTQERQVLISKTIKAKEIQIPFLFLVLNEDNELPTEKSYYETLEECWNKYGPKKGDLNEFKAFIVVTKIKNEHGRVSYPFDELKD